MQPKQLQHSKGTELDRLFEQGVSNIERAPQKTLSDEQIKVAAAASKGGVGIWLLAHAKEILIVLILFLVGVVATILVAFAIHTTRSSSKFHHQNGYT